MTLGSAVARFDTLFPNAFPYAEKLKWISDLDGAIFYDVMSRYENGPDKTFEPYVLTTDKHTVLLVPCPYDDIYIKYLSAQCDLAAGDSVRYQNSAAVFNTAYSEFAAHYNRTHTHKNTQISF